MGARGEIFHPEFKAKPYWWEAWEPTAGPSEDPPARVPVAIIGGGYAGLNTALELRRNGIDCCVLEAQDLGFGASTRNGGQVSSGVNIGKGLQGSGMPRDAAARDRLAAALLTDASESFGFLEDIIRRESIDCRWERRGRFVGAYTAGHYRELAARAEVLNRDPSSGARLLPRERQREEIASDFYHGGLLVDRSGALHPALYYRGLLEACRRQGVPLSARAEVTRVEGRRGTFRLKTARGEVAAEEVVVATNGYTGNATPRLRRRVIPLASHIIATEELPADLARSLIPNRRTISNTARILCYYRLSPDGRRMLFGGRARFTQVPPQVSAPILHDFMVQRFPQLKEARITHAWTGNVAFTFDYLPHMGEESGMHYALGCNGSGVAMMTYLGHQIGRKIAGGGNRVTAFEELPIPGRAFYTGNPWFLPLVGSWYRFRDRLDRALG